MGTENWTGFDLDGTLAYYDIWRGNEHIGKPIERTKRRVLHLLSIGIKVKIFTARVASNQPEEEIALARKTINAWCLEHLGQEIEVTAEKDPYLVEFYDDRAIRVEFNTGNIVGEDDIIFSTVGGV